MREIDFKLPPDADYKVCPLTNVCSYSEINNPGEGCSHSIPHDDNPDCDGYVPGCGKCIHVKLLGIAGNETSIESTYKTEGWLLFKCKDTSKRN